MPIPLLPLLPEADHETAILFLAGQIADYVNSAERQLRGEDGEPPNRERARTSLSLARSYMEIAEVVFGGRPCAPFSVNGLLCLLKFQRERVVTERYFDAHMTTAERRAREAERKCAAHGADCVAQLLIRTAVAHTYLELAREWGLP